MFDQRDFFQLFGSKNIDLKKKIDYLFVKGRTTILVDNGIGKIAISLAILKYVCYEKVYTPFNF